MQMGEKIGTGGGTWTHDQKIKSLLLYQLSYAGIKSNKNRGNYIGVKGVILDWPQNKARGKIILIEI